MGLKPTIFQDFAEDRRHDVRKRDAVVGAAIIDDAFDERRTVRSVRLDVENLSMRGLQLQ